MLVFFVEGVLWNKKYFKVETFVKFRRNKEQ